MRRIITRAAVACWIAVPCIVIGCIPSIHPVFREDQLIFDAQVLGVWTQPGSGDRWEVTQRDASSYGVVFKNRDGVQHRFVAYLADIEGTRLLDLAPEWTDTDAGGIFGFHILPLHTVYRVRSVTPALELSAIDFRWFDEYMSSHPQEISSTTAGGRRIVTAPTEHLQAFVLQHRNRFTGQLRLERSSW